MQQGDFDFGRLSRFPDVESPDLVAVDATDRLVLDTAADRLVLAETGEVVVLGDRHGAMALGAWGLHGARGVRVHQDALLGERAGLRNAVAAGAEDEVSWLPLGAELLRGARVVLVQLPRALAELDEWAAAIVRHAAPDVTVVAGGRIKHMSLGMNDVLRRYFDRVDVGHARQKSRVLVATGARPVSGSEPGPPVPVEVPAVEVPGGSVRVVALGGVFAGTSLDIGTRALLAHLDSYPDATDVIDLGCGSGIIASAVALARPAARVTGIDQSAAAVTSTLATAQANRVADRVAAVREDGLAERPHRSADLILCNPPFHTGAIISERLAARMLRDPRRVLRPGGEVWTVYNSALRYRLMLEKLIGPTEEMSRSSKFTVTRSRLR